MKKKLEKLNLKNGDVVVMKGYKAGEVELAREWLKSHGMDVLVVIEDEYRAVRLKAEQVNKISEEK